MVRLFFDLLAGAFDARGPIWRSEWDDCGALTILVLWNAAKFSVLTPSAGLEGMGEKLCRRLRENAF